ESKKEEEKGRKKGCKEKRQDSSFEGHRQPASLSRRRRRSRFGSVDPPSKGCPHPERRRSRRVPDRGSIRARLPTALRRCRATNPAHQATPPFGGADPDRGIVLATCALRGDAG